MKNYLDKNHRIIGFLCALASAGIAILYFIVLPNEAATASGIQKVVLTYGHSLCWILLCVASIFWAVKGKSTIAKYLAYSALLTYVVFIGLVIVRAAGLD